MKEETKMKPNDSKPRTRYLLTDESFQSLRQLQEEISEMTDVTPTLRKCINLLITPNNLNNIKEDLLVKLR